MSVVTLVPYEAVPQVHLRPLLESFITREGTDYGEVEHSLEDKLNRLGDQLRRREIHIIFDGESETFNLITAQDARSLGILSESPGHPKA